MRIENGERGHATLVSPCGTYIWKNDVSGVRIADAGGQLILLAGTAEMAMARRFEPPTSEDEWQEQVKRIVKAELARAGMTYKELAKRLKAMGVQEIAEANLKNKISRGTFSATFFMQCLNAAGTSALFLTPVPLATIKSPGAKDMELLAEAADAILADDNDEPVDPRP